MGTVSDARKADYAALESRAIDLLNRAAEDLVNWVELIHDPDMPWAFRWAPDSVRGANVGATNYILEAARRCGVLDRISWTGRWRQRDEYDTAPFVEVGKSLLIARVPTTANQLSATRLMSP